MSFVLSGLHVFSVREFAYWRVCWKWKVGEDENENENEEMEVRGYLLVVSFA